MKVEVEVAKESHEIFVALASIIADVKTGKPVGEIALGNFSKLQTAIEGWEKLDEEAKTAAFYRTVALGTASIAGVLLAPKAE